MDDTWWAFIAGIDRQKLLQELPGSAADRRMREQHKARTEDLKLQRAAGVDVQQAIKQRQDEALGDSRLATADREARDWLRRHPPKPRRRGTEQAEHDIAAYAARKRGHAA